MGINIDSIGTGKDHATIAIWEAATDYDLVSATTKEIGQIETNENFDASHVMAGATTNGTYYRNLKVAAANRHQGIEGTGHARIYRNSSGHAIDIQENYFVLENLDINLETNQAVSDECIRINDGVTALISRLIVHMDSSQSQCDGIYTDAWPSIVYVDNCMVYYFQRTGMHAQNYTGSSTQTWHVDLCTVQFCGRSGSGDDSCITLVAASLATVNFNAYNTIAQRGQATGQGDFEEASTGGTYNWAGSNNIAGDASAEDKFTASYDSVATVESAPGSGQSAWYNEIDHPSEDYRLAGENAYTVTQNGVDRRGSEPANSVWADNPQDFKYDIAGRFRGSSPSIGAYQFELPKIVPPKWDYFYRRHVA